MYQLKLHKEDKLQWQSDKREKTMKLKTETPATERMSSYMKPTKAARVVLITLKHEMA